MSEGRQAVHAKASASAESESAVGLLEQALQKARTWMRFEISLARDEVEAEVTRAKSGFAVALAAFGASWSAFAVFMVAIALASARPWLAALLVGAALLFASAVLALFAWRLLRKKPLPETTGRLERDLRELRDRTT